MDILFILGCFTHHDRPQHGYKAADSLSVLYKSLPEGLLLCLLQQNELIADILHGTVQLGLDITATFKKENTHMLNNLHKTTPLTRLTPLTTCAEGIERAHFNMHELHINMIIYCSDEGN